MHTYDIDSTERRDVIALIVLLGIATAYGIHLLTDQADVDWWWLEIPGPIAAAGLLYWWFERWGWKIKVLHSISVVRTPILEGDWVGTLWSSHDNDNGSDEPSEREFQLSIRQTWTRVHISARTAKSRSSSEVASLRVNDGARPILVYNYLNEPSADAVETMNIHYGTAVHEFDGISGSLSGHYYTGRGRMTWGRMTLARRPQ